MYILDMNVQILKSMYSNYLQKKPISQNDWLVWLVDFQRFSFNIFNWRGGGLEMYRGFARKMVQIQSANKLVFISKRFTACSHSTCTVYF